MVRGGVRHVHGGGCVHVFEGAASFPSLTWSPDGKWLLVAWPAADQLVFVRVGTAPKLVAVSNVLAPVPLRLVPERRRLVALAVARVIEVGQSVPDARVQRALGDTTTLTELLGDATTLAELAADGPILLVFYLFDWSST